MDRSPPSSSVFLHWKRCQPYVKIITLFLIWKSLILFIAFITPSPAYDTSTSIMLQRKSNFQHNHWKIQSLANVILHRICDRLARWDAIYFSKIAERGYSNEQEWAFGWGYTQAIVLVREVLSKILPHIYWPSTPHFEVMCGILISNICHLISVFVLYQLTLISSTSHVYSENFALLTSFLHILSPAGLFLSAPYSESLFSALNFMGSYLYILSLKQKDQLQHSLSCIHIIASALVFALGCTVRTNGVLNGILFVVDGAIESRYFLKRFDSPSFFRTISLGLGGLIIALGVIFPQIIAWRQFCVSTVSRPGRWCQNSIPSIYFWVQDHYWNVGLFRYWTVSNIPLFLLALPTLTLLLQSGMWGIRISLPSQKIQSSAKYNIMNSKATFRLALPQILLAVIAIFSYHVQIVTRLSSGYVLMYWWIGSIYIRENLENPGNDAQKPKLKSIWVIRWMVMYGLLQGVLFAGFLPPA